MRVVRSPLALGMVVAALLSACGGDDGGVADTAPAVTEAAADTAATDPAPTGDGGSATNAGCPPSDGAATQTRTFAESPPMCLDADATYEAVVVTNKGEFTIELDQSRAPVTTNNFVFLARNRYFDDTVCHRIIPGFVVQCGDPTATGTGGPGYTIIDEPPAAGEYRIGSIAMAKTAAPDSGGSQFFIITGPQGAALPPEYSLFGQVVDGFDSTVVAMEAAGTGAGTPVEPIEIQSITIRQT
jgi:cyclophilin family peptidyl-prolyl cis-trans isomerase